MTEFTERPTAETGWGYRPALDGLRVLAVYAVVLFHAGLPTFGGGFIGVDLFFVLSGYLVTNTILQRLRRTGRLDLWHFYARRIRRLLPAAALAITGTLVAMAAVAPGFQRVEAAEDARASLLYVANWHFLADARDYFAAEGAKSPLEHYWSLSIEEQFYFAFPLLLIVLIRRGTEDLSRRLLRTATVLLAVGAAWQWWVGRSDPSWAYFGTDARLYQLLAGVVLALLLRRSDWGVRLARRELLGTAVLAASAALFLTLVVLPPLTPSTRGLLATVAAAGLVGGAELAQERADRLLGHRPLTYLGQISYGTYLWHWPIIVVAGLLVDTTPVVLAVVSAIGGTAMAALSNELVEQPVRSSAWLDPRRRSVVTTGLAASVSVGLLVVPAVALLDGRPIVSGIGRVEVADGTPVDPSLDFAELASTGLPFVRCGADGTYDGCIDREGDGLHVHIIGDSHGAAMMAMWRDLADRRGLTLSATLIGGCPWQRGLLMTYDDGAGREERCAGLQPLWHDEVIPALSPDIVVAVNRTYDDPNSPRVMADTSLVVPEDQTELIRRTSTGTVERWRRDGIHVVLVEPIPIAPVRPDGSHFDPVECLGGATLVEECTFEATSQTKPTEEIYRDLAGGDEGVDVLDLDELTCPGFPRCPAIVDSMVVRFDHHHLAKEFAASRGEELGRLLEQIGVLPRATSESASAAVG